MGVGPVDYGSVLLLVLPSVGRQRQPLTTLAAIDIPHRKGLPSGVEGDFLVGFALLSIIFCSLSNRSTSMIGNSVNTFSDLLSPLQRIPI